MALPDLPDRQGVIFDLDGVLIDSREYHLRSWYRLAEGLEAPMSDAFFAETFGQHNSQILPRLLGRELPPAEMRELSERKEAFYREEARERISLVQGAEALFLQLRRAGYRLALGTSTPKSNLDFLVAELRLDRHLDAFACGDDVAHGKPDPEVFLLAGERLGVPAPRCVVVEDAPVGIEAAARAGMACVALATTHPAADLRRCPGADLVLASLGDLTAAMLQSLIGTAEEAAL